MKDPPILKYGVRNLKCGHSNLFPLFFLGGGGGVGACFLSVCVCFGHSLQPQQSYQQFFPQLFQFQGQGCGVPFVALGDDPISLDLAKVLQLPHECVDPGDSHSQLLLFFIEQRSYCLQFCVCKKSNFKFYLKK